MAAWPHLKAIGDVEFGGRDPHQVIHQHHDHDGEEHGEVADGRPHLREHKKQLWRTFPHRASERAGGPVDQAVAVAGD